MNSAKQKAGYFEGVLSTVLNTALFVLKLLVGLSAGSVAMVADAWHTMSDTLTSLVVIFGFRIAGKPGDTKHPFGHGRAELIAAVIIGTLLAIVGVNFCRDSWMQLRSRHAAVFGTTSMIVFAVSVLLKEALARFSMALGRKYDSQSLVADGWHHRSDAIASLLIIIGALFSRWFWWIDGTLGFIVSFLILHAAYTIIRDASDSLLGTSPQPDLERRIADLARECSPVITDVHHLHVHRYGDHIEVTLHARMPENEPLGDAHRAATRLEESIRRELSMESTIHLEPVKSRPA